METLAFVGWAKYKREFADWVVQNEKRVKHINNATAEIRAEFARDEIGTRTAVKMHQELNMLTNSCVVFGYYLALKEYK